MRVLILLVSALIWCTSGVSAKAPVGKQVAKEPKTNPLPLIWTGYTVELHAHVDFPQLVATLAVAPEIERAYYGYIPYIQPLYTSPHIAEQYSQLARNSC